MIDFISTTKKPAPTVEDRITIWTYKVYRKNSIDPIFIQSRLYADEIGIRLDAALVHIVDSHTPDEIRRKNK